MTGSDTLREVIAEFAAGRTAEERQATLGALHLFGFVNTARLLEIADAAIREAEDAAAGGAR